MKVTALKLANVRTIETAEFRFQSGFNLIVGVNGVGKTSVLDALSVCLAATLNHANKLRMRPTTLRTDDIRVGAEALDVDCGFEISGRQHHYVIHKPHESSALQAQKAGMPREQVHDTPERAEFAGEPPASHSGDGPGARPLAVLFSTNRAVPSERAPTKGMAVGGVAAAFAGALSRRELRLGEFAAWIRVQQTLRTERPAAKRVLAALEVAVSRFLPDYGNLRLDTELSVLVDDNYDAIMDGKGDLLATHEEVLMIDHGMATIPVRHLSDGERGILALVLDLTRRLSQANPELEDPAMEAEAVVLIDEIELHLHPTWQRQVVRKLTATFPRCQFIATTHSPQVIGEVEHDRIHIMADGEVYSPTHSFGVDSSRVLEEIMEADSRTERIRNLLTAVSSNIGKQHYGAARELLAQLVSLLGENDPEVTRVATLLDFLEGEA